MFRLKLFGIGLMAAMLIACTNEVEKSSDVSPVPVYSFDELKPVLDRSNDTLYIYNFWATWCGPCIKEMPHFEKVNKDYASRKVKVVLVSLDYEEDIETKLIPFINERHIRSEVVNLSDPNANRWIPMVDPSWDGAIPATLFRIGKDSRFMAHTFTHDELVNEIETLLKQ